MDAFENLMESYGFLLQRNEHDHTHKMLYKSHATHVHISGNLRPLENAGLVNSTANASPQAVLFLHTLSSLHHCWACSREPRMIAESCL